MNDSFVSPCQPPLQAKNAYILFYCREKGQMLNDAIHGGSTQGAAGAGGKKKRPRESMEAESSKGSPSSQSWKGIPNGSPSPAHGPSPAKKQHLQHSNTGPRPPVVVASSAHASASTLSSAFPPTDDDDDSPTPTSMGKGVFASRSDGLSKRKEKRQDKKQRLAVQAVGKMKAGSTVSRMKGRAGPKLLRD